MAESSADAIKRGGALLSSGQVIQSLRVFDDVLRLHPSTAPTLWQRGLALYYAGRFVEGAEQFETNMQVNGADAEELIWRFACDVHRPGVSFDQAGQRLRALAKLRKEGDERVPMEQLLLLFGGEEGSCSAAIRTVMETARQAAPKAYGDAYGVEGVVGGVFQPVT